LEVDRIQVWGGEFVRQINKGNRQIKRNLGR
jgi:hypothetical protein